MKRFRPRPRLTPPSSGVLPRQPLQPGFGPSMQQPIPLVRDYGYGNQLPPGSIGFPKPMQLSSQIDPNSPRSLPFASAVGPSMQGVGDPRLGAATIPGNKLQMQMRGPQQTPMQQFSYGGRAGYQMGGIMGLENGQEESIFPRLETLNQNLGQAEQTLGTPYDNQSYSSPIFDALTGSSQMNLGGRLGYQEGGMGMEQMMPQQMESPEGIMGIMQPEAGGMMQPPMQDSMQGQLGEGDNALLTIIQLLIEQGVPPEQAEQLARQILQVFAQGGEPAVEAFADQLEQEEQMQMMASGGVAGLYSRQNYGFGSFVKGIVKGAAKAVKSIVKSPIGKIALTIGATMLMGPAGFNLAAGQFGITNAFLAGAVNAGAANLLVQGVTTGKINPKEALLAGAIGGVTGSLSSGTSQGGINPDVGGIPDAMQPPPSPPPTVTSNLAETFSTPNIQPDIGSYAGSVQNITDVGMITPSPEDVLSNVKASNLASSQGQTLQQLGELTPKPTGFFENITNQAQQFGTNLINDPLKTIQTGIGSLYDTTKENIGPLALGFGLGTQFRDPLPGEDPNEYNKLKEAHDNEVKKYYNLYSGNINPTAPLALAANGGRIGYEYGSMPMGEPKRNPAGIMELDYRAKGGFVPPIGIKEKADDIPAMLSNNEFVFTANAVRNAGEGNVNKGAQRMYKLMKQLEAGGVV